MTVDGFGFGTLTGESCLKNVHCHTDRASWGAILVTVVAFGALMWKTCAQSHRFGLGRVGGGGYHGGGVGEPRTGIIYTASCGHGMGRACWLPIRLRVGMACWLPNPGQHGGCDKLLASCSRASPSSMLARGLVKGTHSTLAIARGQNISRGLLVH